MLPYNNIIIIYASLVYTGKDQRLNTHYIYYVTKSNIYEIYVNIYNEI